MKRTPPERTCKTCGKKERTNSRSEICAECYVAQKKLDKIEEEKKHIIEYGLEIVSGPIPHPKFNKRVYTLRNPECGHAFEVRYDNFQGTIRNDYNEKLGKLWCGVCAQRDKHKFALSGFKTKYGIDRSKLDIENPEEYSKLVRMLSEEVYQSNLEILNPTKLKRGRSDKVDVYQLDHIVPIAICFRYGVTPEKAASLENLQMIPARENNSKSWYRFDADLLDRLLGVRAQHDKFGINILYYAVKNDCPEILLRDNTLVKNDRTVCMLLDDTKTLLKKQPGVLYIRKGELHDKRDIVLSRLRNRLGLSTRIFARKCKIIEVSSTIATAFLEQNHIQGKVGSAVRYGLEYEGELVALMTFGKPRFNAHYKWELLRYCTKLHMNIIGGASRLLSHFRKLRDGAIISYADMRWSDGALYEQLGFTKHEQSEGSSSYFYTDGKVILKRYAAQKHKLPKLLGDSYNPNMTEKDNMLNAGYAIVYDPGQLVFTLG